MILIIVISVLMGLLIALVQEFLINKEAIKSEKLYSDYREQIHIAITHFDRLNENRKTKSNGILNVYAVSAEWSMESDFHKVSTEIPYSPRIEKMKINILEEYNHSYLPISFISI